MKRKDFLGITGCSVKQFDNMKLRGQLPFVPHNTRYFLDPEGKHADYTMSDAFQLRVFLDAAENKGLSIEAAKYIAGNCIRHLRLVSENAKERDADLWIFYAQGYLSKFADTGELWTPRRLGAGRLEDLANFAKDKTDWAETQFIAVFNASMASASVIAAAMSRDLIVPDDEPMRHLWERDYETVAAEIEG